MGKIQIKEVTLNNKSRQGTYIYVKEYKRAGRYYKKKEGVSNENYIQVYQSGGLHQKRGGLTKEKVKVIRRRKKKKLVEIDKVLNDGYAQNTIINAERLTPFGIKTAYMNLLRNKDKAGDGKGVVRDKELLDIITRPDDVEKWKHRVMYEIELVGGNRVLARANNQVPKSLGVVVSDLRELRPIKREVDGYGNLSKSFSSKSYTFERIADGRVNTIRIKMVFRKGR